VTKEGVYRFISGQKLAVVSSIGSDGTPQSAVIGIGVTPELDIVFDTLNPSRKAQNLVARPTCSLVVGWDDEITVQYEGLAAQHLVNDEGNWKEAYFRSWPDGRERMSWPGLVYFVVSPKWIRYSDFNRRPPEIAEFTF
jgi:pyridoxine/pyridoxamine 5'-phosphate oxidase